MGWEWRKGQGHGAAPHGRVPQGWWESVVERSRQFLKWALEVGELHNSLQEKLTSAANRPMLGGVVSYR